MKHQFRTNPRRLLTLAAVIVLLAVSLTACFGNKKPEETINNLPSGTGASEPSKPADTVPPTTIPEPETVWGTVNTDKLNVRTEPSTDSPAPFVPPGVSYSTSTQCNFMSQYCVHLPAMGHDQPQKTRISKHKGGIFTLCRGFFCGK